jgi:hydrogenase expression/formation protein HypC
MCLAIPATVVSVTEGFSRMAEVDILGVSRTVSLDLVPEADIGDHVLVHAGYAIQVVDEEFAAETIRLLMTLNPSEEDLDGIDPSQLKTAGEPAA